MMEWVLRGPDGEGRPLGGCCRCAHGCDVWVGTPGTRAI